MTRAVNGLSFEPSQSASARRRPDVLPSGRGISVAGFPYVSTVGNAGFISEPLLSGSPRTRKLVGGVSCPPGALWSKVPFGLSGGGSRHFGHPIVSSPRPFG